jgi:hypothetical protein
MRALKLLEKTGFHFMENEKKMSWAGPSAGIPL